VGGQGKLVLFELHFCTGCSASIACIVCPGHNRRRILLDSTSVDNPGSAWACMPHAPVSTKTTAAVHTFTHYLCLPPTPPPAHAGGQDSSRQDQPKEGGAEGRHGQW
jgi:hypothetical protein